VAAVARGGSASARRLLLPPTRRRSALYLAAALVTATSLGTVTAGGPPAVAATPVAHSVSIAHELGIDRQPDTVTAADAQHLRQLAASRNQRGAEEAAAAQVQVVADQRATRAARAAARPKAVLPVAGARLTSTFGMRWGTLHAGIDLAAPLGTPEYAVMDGVVLRAGPASGFGLAVYIQHANGDVTVYGHMERILVTEGQVVRAGDTIALLGANGQATGPHLHLEVHVAGMMGTKIDPLPWLRERGVAI
jgi:murein DD-endopeptidase MepM/ murein hydrolase activator NlpD